MLDGFLNSGFGRSIEMAVGFGISADLSNKIFQTDTGWRVRIRHSFRA